MEKRNLRKLFYNNRFLLILSLLAACAFWLGTSISDNESNSRVIYNVPITVSLSDSAQNQKLHVYGQSQTMGAVSITGSKLIINKINPDDLKITAVLNPASEKTSTSGMETYTLTLIASKNGNELADFDVVQVEPATIEVQADIYKEFTFPIENGIEYSVDEHYFANTPVLSEESVVISGPQSSVKRISRVVAQYKLPEVLTESRVFTSGLVLYDAYGKVIADDYLDLSVNLVEANISVLNRKTLSIVPNIINKPVGFADSRITVSPATVEVAGPAESLAGLTKINLDTVIDFTRLTPANNTVDMDFSVPTGLKNLSNTLHATVNVDMSGYEQASFVTTNIVVKNKADDQKVELLTKELEVAVFGEQSQISRLTGDAIYCTVDMLNVRDVFGSMELTAKVSVVEANTCWVYGNYTINVNVTQEEPTSSQAQP